jgi:hypothetical protein
MSDETRENPQHQAQDRSPGPDRGPMFLIPKSFIYLVGAIVVGSFLLTLFVRNPYTQAVEGGDLYERSQDNSLMLWVAIFVGIPASFYAYKRWVLPLFERK